MRRTRTAIFISQIDHHKYSPKFIFWFIILAKNGWVSNAGLNRRFFFARFQQLATLFIEHKIASAPPELNVLAQNSHITRMKWSLPTGANRIPVTQAGITLAGVVIFAFVSLPAAYSALLGGLACVAPNAYAVWRVFGAGRDQTHSGLRTFGLMIRAEFAKFALTGAIFALIFWLVPDINPFAMFTVFVIALFAGWIEAGLRLDA